VVYEPEAAIVRRIFADYLHGLACRKIAAALVRESIPGPYGGKLWHGSTIYYMLKQPGYAGKMLAFRNHHTFRKAVNKLSYEVEKREGRVVRDATDASVVPLLATACPAVVTEDVWQQVQAGMARAQRFNPRNQADPEATLLRGGFALCGHCGRVMTSAMNHGAYRYHCHASNNGYVCPGGLTMMTASDLDRLVWEVISQTILNAGWVRTLLEETHGTHEQHAEAAAANTRAIDGQIKETQQAIETLMARLERPGLDEARLVHHRKMLKRLDVRRVDAASATVEARAKDEALIAFQSWAGQVAPHLDSLTYQEKRTLLVGLDVRAVVWRKQAIPRALVLLRFGELVQAYATGMQALPLYLEQQTSQLVGLWDSWETLRATLQERVAPVLEHWKGRLDTPYRGQFAFSTRRVAG
jgi:Recombinase/Recombinase zinc beta ribbon domain